MGDGGLAAVTGAGRARKGEDEEKRAERVVEEDMGCLIDTKVCIGGDAEAVGTYRKVL